MKTIQVSQTVMPELVGSYAHVGTRTTVAVDLRWCYTDSWAHTVVRVLNAKEVLTGTPG